MELTLSPDGYLRDVAAIHGHLDSAYPWSDLGNKSDPLEELIYILLSTRTREGFYQTAFERVRELVGDWEYLPEIEFSDLVRAVGSAGLAEKKAGAMIDIATALRELFGAVTLNPLRAVPTSEAEPFLTSLPHVGIKVAKCVLMYSLNRQVFPIDVHCDRVGSRIGWFPPTLRPKSPAQQRTIESAIPKEIRKSLHVRLIQHGRMICLARDPECERCVIREMCDYGRRE